MASRDLAIVLLLGLISGQTAQPPPACIGLFVGAAPATAPDISGATIKDGIWVPAKMTERYDYPTRLYDLFFS
jgi:hypothetical protein